MQKLLADIDLTQKGFEGYGPLGLPDPQNPANAPFVFSNFVSSSIGLITIIGIIWTIFTIMTGAISFITSGGDKAAIEAAKKKIFNGVVGLIIIIVSMFVISLIGLIIGINFLDFVALYKTLI